MSKYILSLLLIFPICADNLSGKVIKVTDGDTVQILLANHKIEKIRLAGIDAPERKQAHGSKAKRYLSSLIAKKIVTIEYNKRDKYKRIVGKILYNGTDINLRMVQVGYAWWYEKYKHEQSLDDQIKYKIAESNAQKFNLGLFQNEAIPPWRWRKNKKNLRKVKLKSKPQIQNVLLEAKNSTVKVWINLKSKKYHCPNTRFYQNTQHGKIMTESLAIKSGFTGAHGVNCL